MTKNSVSEKGSCYYVLEDAFLLELDYQRAGVYRIGFIFIVFVTKNN
jgi:hypothetical protein